MRVLDVQGKILKKEMLKMESNWKKKLLMGGMAFALTLGSLAGCGDGVDQDNGVDDGQQNDEMDEKNTEEG